MKKSQKRYVVREWHKTGIFDNWSDCQKAVHGYKDAEYKSFTDKNLAAQAFGESYEQYKWVKTNGKIFSESEKKQIWQPIMSSISVDAACSSNPWILEFRGVTTDTCNEIFSFWPFPDGTVNIGEFLALVEGLKYAKANQVNLIYTDSRTARARVRDRKVRTTLIQSDKNKVLFDMIQEALSWLLTNDISTIDIRKRETQLRGEVPADYGRK